jgi:hypothetical protein
MAGTLPYDPHAAKAWLLNCIAMTLTRGRDLTAKQDTSLICAVGSLLQRGAVQQRSCLTHLTWTHRANLAHPQAHLNDTTKLFKSSASIDGCSCSYSNNDVGVTGVCATQAIHTNSDLHTLTSLCALLCFVRALSFPPRLFDSHEASRTALSRPCVCCCPS